MAINARVRVRLRAESHGRRQNVSAELREWGTIVVNGKSEQLAYAGQEAAHLTLPNGEAVDLYLRPILPNE